jgi:hypothetical protein
MPNSALIVYISGNDSSSALKARLISKGYGVHCIAIDPADGRIRWHPDNGPAPDPRPLGSVVYDTVFIVRHHALDRGMPTRRGVALGDRLLPTSHLIDMLVAAGLHEPSRFILIVCNAARGSSTGNVMEDDIGYSTGHNFASRLSEIDWFTAEVHAYKQEVGVIDEGTHALMQTAACHGIIQATKSCRWEAAITCLAQSASRLENFILAARRISALNLASSEIG